MLNPSVADGTRDDPTLTRCQRFARSWGCAAVRVLNVYAYRATDPRQLWQVPDPVGPDNDQHLGTAAASDLVVAAWGTLAKPSRVQHVLSLPGFQRLTALGVTQAGHPRHPLYLPATARPVPWQPGSTPKA